MEELTLPLCVSSTCNRTPCPFTAFGVAFFRFSFSLQHFSVTLHINLVPSQSSTEGVLRKLSNTLNSQSSVSSKFQPSIFISRQQPDITTAEMDKKWRRTKQDMPSIKENGWVEKFVLNSEVVFVNWLERWENCNDILSTNEAKSSNSSRFWEL